MLVQDGSSTVVTMAGRAVGAALRRPAANPATASSAARATTNRSALRNGKRFLGDMKSSPCLAGAAGKECGPR